MLDIELFRENPEEIKASEERRGKNPEKVEEVVNLDEEWREKLQKVEELRAERNRVGDEIAELKQSGEDAEDKIERMSEVKEEISELEDEVEALKQQRDELRFEIGNILHESVPQGEDEHDNKEIKTWEPETGTVEDARLAADIIDENNLIHAEKAAENAGERAYYLKGDLFRLNQALIQFSIYSYADSLHAEL